MCVHMDPTLLAPDVPILQLLPLLLALPQYLRLPLLLPVHVQREPHQVCLIVAGTLLTSVPAVILARNTLIDVLIIILNVRQAHIHQLPLVIVQGDALQLPFVLLLAQ